MPKRPRRSWKNCASRLAALIAAAAIAGFAHQAWAGQIAASGPVLAAVAQPKAAGQKMQRSSKPVAGQKIGKEQEKPAGKSSLESKGAEGTESEKDKVIVEHADKLSYDGDKKLYRLQGNVRIRHKDTILTCDWAEYHEDTDTAVARGHLLLKDPETSVTGDVISVDFTDEVAVVEGHVVIVTQKKKKGGKAGKEGEQAQGAGQKNKEDQNKGSKANKSAGSAEKSAAAEGGQQGEEKAPSTIEEYRERKTIIYCEKVKYKYTDGERYAWITGPIRAEQKDRTAWADRAEYDVEDGVLKLFGNVRVKTADGDEFQCPTAIISIDEEWLRAEKVTGVAIRKKKKKSSTAPEKKSAPKSSQPSARPSSQRESEQGQ